MIVLDYNNIKNKVKEYYIQRLYFKTEYKDDSQKQVILSKALGKKGYNEEEIYSFIEFCCNKYRVYEYESRSKGTDKIRENFLISKDNLPILKFSHYEPKNNNTSYSEDTYIMYQEDSNRMDSKISITSLKAEDFEDTNVIVLYSGEPFSMQYYQKRYHFLIKGDDILSLGIGNEMFLNGEEGFSIRCDSALKCIGKIFSKITQKIERTMEQDDVKEYCIKRHRK